ncbi:MAG: DUF1800 domain-containing protein [Pseudomonadota bacterium]
MCRPIIIASLVSLLLACGGGGGSGGNQTTTTTPPGGGSAPPTPPPAPADPTTAELNSASRFLARTTFGATWEEIDAVARQGEALWLDTQFATPASKHLQTVATIYDALESDDNLDPDGFWRYAWWSTVLPADDQLRQRVAYALSQIFVVSAQVEELPTTVVALPAYYDLLAEHAFGNFRDLLRAVTLSPAMGLYLSHLNNAKANPATNTFPDENYAREVMQLFSIGLFELNADGSQRLDNNGQPIPTYDNDDIREFAEVFTGLSFGGDNQTFGTRFGGDWAVPMRMFDEAHDESEKNLLNGTTLPAGQSGIEDLDGAIDNLFNHPNVGPFIGRQLIQRLVTSNPSPAYIGRVTEAFNAAPRGDMRRLLRAILLDPEATAAVGSDDRFGKLREPFLRYVALNRQLGAAPESGSIFGVDGGVVRFTTGQHVLESPSVFNFYSPDFVPSQAFAADALVAPEFQITTANKVIGVSNLIAFSIFSNTLDTTNGLPEILLNVEDLETLATDLDALLDRLDTQFTYGTLRPEARTAIRDAAAITAEPADRLQIALYLLLNSPDYAVAL